MYNVPQAWSKLGFILYIIEGLGFGMARMGQWRKAQRVVKPSFRFSGHERG